MISASPPLPVTAVTSLGYIKYSLTPQFRALIVAINNSAFGLMRLINATTSDVKEYINSQTI